MLAFMRVTTVFAIVLFLVSIESHAGRLHDAIRSGQIPRIRWILEQGDDLNERCAGFTPVELAQELGRDDIVEILMSYARLPKVQPRGLRAIARVVARPFLAVARPVRELVLERERQRFRRELALPIPSLNIHRDRNLVLGVPDDVWALVCTLMSPVDVGRMQQVCTRFWHIVQHASAPKNKGGLGRPHDFPFAGMIQLPGGPLHFDLGEVPCYSPTRITLVDGILYVQETIMQSYRDGPVVGMRVASQPVFAIDPRTMNVDGPLERAFPPDERAFNERLDSLRVHPIDRLHRDADLSPFLSRLEENTVGHGVCIGNSVCIGNFMYDALKGCLVIRGAGSEVSIKTRHPVLEVLGRFNGFVYVSNTANSRGSDTPRDLLLVFDAQTGMFVSEIEIGSSPQMPVLIGNFLFVSSRHDGVYVVSIETQTVVAVIKALGNLAVVGDLLFVADDKQRAIYYYDISAFHR